MADPGAYTQRYASSANTHAAGIPSSHSGRYGAGGGTESPSPSLQDVDVSPVTSPVPSGNSYGGGSSQYAPPYGAGASFGSSSAAGATGMRQRHNAVALAASPLTSYGGARSPDGKYRKTRKLARRLDLFPKVQEDYQVRTDRGGQVTLFSWVVIGLLVLAEIASHRAEQGRLVEHTYVDTSLNTRMRVDLNITFPALHCDDMHLDAMDVAGDSQLDIADTLVKKRLHLDGTYVSQGEIRVEANKHASEDIAKKEMEEKFKDGKLPANYCGSCYGAEANAGACCNTCDDVIQAYRAKRWGSNSVVLSAEQCKREGKSGQDELKHITGGEGCNLSGYMTFKRVAGNFHIAMGEGVERNGRHIHKFNPEDAPNFNASHVINRLSFGPDYGFVDYATGDGRSGTMTLDGVSKTVTHENGETGLFQYFIKIVPTSYMGEAMMASLKPGSFANGNLPGRDALGRLNTNRYFFTERFRPLMTDIIGHEHHELGEKMGEVGTHAGGATGVGKQASKDSHHQVQNSILPGVFFIYEIYPFAVEVRKTSVPFTHLLIRIMATVGGVFTIVGWADSYFYSRDKNRRRR